VKLKRGKLGKKDSLLMEHVFGPVHSRRLGMSLGIDPIPLKTCNWNCIYCQLGRTIPLTNERREYFPRQEILDGIFLALDKHSPGEVDWVTFVGSGEPTLHTGLGWLIRGVKRVSTLPVAVITNGALLYLPDVRRELSAADAVLPSLDAGDARQYKKINRPWPALEFERIIEGMAAFRREYSGELWIEVMLVHRMNDSEQSLRQIASLIQAIHPDQVHINQPVRPPAEAWVLPPDEATILLAAEIFGEIAIVVPPTKVSIELSQDADIVQSILQIIHRHPMEECELLGALHRRRPEEVNENLRLLQISGRAQVVERYGQRYWSAAAALYSDSK
jgi:wyosine [tRNA(Phe)-imidazoG37] synthetase (radical SAM superfamily)